MMNLRRGIFSVLIILFAQPAFAFRIVSFNGQFTRWSGNQVHYQFDSRGSADFNGDATHGCDAHGACVTVAQALAKSFATWKNVAGASVNFIQDSPTLISNTGYDGKNQIVFVEKNWEMLPFAPPSGALAVTISTYKVSNSEIVDSDIHFNGTNFNWAVINSADEQSLNVVDIQNIATHEIGHFIGLDHSSEDIFEPINKLYLATMFFASGPGEIFRRDLHDDDLEAATNLYPDSAPVDPEIDAVSPGEIDSQQTRIAEVTISGRNFKDNSTTLLATNSEFGDIVGKVLSSSDREIVVQFDASALRSGKYDLVVANSYNRFARSKSALTILGGFGGSPDTDNSAGYSSGGGGCSLSVTDRSSPSPILLLLFPLLWFSLSAYRVRSGMLEKAIRVGAEESTS